MTKERKNYYLKWIKRKLWLASFGLTKEKTLLSELKETINAIQWNNPKEEAMHFIQSEVIPLLKKYGILVEEL